MTVTIASNRNFLCMVAAEDVGDSVCDISIVSVDIVVVIIVVVVSVVDVSFVSAGVTSVGLGNSSHIYIYNSIPYQILFVLGIGSSNK